MLKPVSRENAQHSTWGDKCDGWHLLRNSDLSVIEEQMPPGASEVRHYHQKAQQFFFILSGQASLEVDGEQITLSVGEGVSIPPGTRHRFHNDSKAPVTFLVISQPPSHGDRVTE